MNEGRRTEIWLLDGRKLDIVVQPRLYVDELLNIVASHCNLRNPDKQLFGLAFVDENHQYHWFPHDKRVLEFELPRKYASISNTLILRHNVRFFVDSVTNLTHPFSVELYFLDAKSQLFRDCLELSDSDLCRIYANLMQIYNGDMKDDETARRLLRKTLAQNLSKIENEQKIIEIYRLLNGTSRGVAILNFMQIVERSETYGTQFYSVSDKAGEVWKLSLTCRGICKFDANDRKKPKKVFHWKHLENLFYRDRKFSIEVHDTRKVVQSLSSLHYQDLIVTEGNTDDDLLKAVCDPTTLVSVSRRAFAPSSLHLHAFFLPSSFMCKSLWSAAIAQHQFYLDQKSTKAGAVGSNEKLSTTRSTVNMNNLIEKLNQFGGSTDWQQSGILSKIDTESSISCSLPSLQIQNSKEEKQRDLETYRILKVKKSELEESMVQKLKQLKQICIQEGEITGNLPKEIGRTLTPGEIEPKIKRRVGTGFSISYQMLETQSKSDRLELLTADVELHRKIVSAAQKLASDKSRNKSVRKKRHKDWQTANGKLRSLEVQLNQLTMSASRPELFEQDQKAWPNYHGRPKFEHMGSLCNAVQSCPATPRGSIGNLWLESDRNDTDGSRPATWNNLEQRAFSTGKSTINSYENVGYKSSHPYECPYRRSNFPTLIDGQISFPRSQSVQNIMPNDGKFTMENDAQMMVQNQPEIGLYNVPKQRTSWQSGQFPLKIGTFKSLAKKLTRDSENDAQFGRKSGSLDRKINNVHRNINNAHRNINNAHRNCGYPLSKKVDYLLKGMETVKSFHSSDVVKYCQAKSPTMISKRKSAAPESDGHLETLLNFYRTNAQKKPKTYTIV